MNSNDTETTRDFRSAILGRTGLRVGRLGVAASYGVPASAVEHAFDCGVNYFYWGSRRTGAFADALRNLKVQRERLVLTIQSYSRVAGLLAGSLERALRTVGYDYADVLLLGMWNHEVPPRILDAARKLKERGLTRFLGISTHSRARVPIFASGNEFDVVHLRYNAAHPGAEQDIFPLLPEDGRAGLVSFTATSWGQLVGKPAFFLQGRRIPPGENVPSGTDCYRFVLTRPEIDVCLSGPANTQHMDQAIEALRLGPMSEGELAWMRRVGRAISGK